LPTPHVIIPPGKDVLDEEQVVEVKLCIKGRRRRRWSMSGRGWRLVFCPRERTIKALIQLKEEELRV
jgi:hypothetical protein